MVCGDAISFRTSVLNAASAGSKVSSDISMSKLISTEASSKAIDTYGEDHMLHSNGHVIIANNSKKIPGEISLSLKTNSITKSGASITLDGKGFNFTSWTNFKNITFAQSLYQLNMLPIFNNDLSTTFR